MPNKTDGRVLTPVLCNEIERSAYLDAISDVCKYLKNKYKIAKLLNHLEHNKELSSKEYETLWEAFITLT